MTSGPRQPDLITLTVKSPLFLFSKKHYEWKYEPVFHHCR